MNSPITDAHFFTGHSREKRLIFGPGDGGPAWGGVGLGWSGVAGWDMSTVWSRPLAEALAARPLPAMQGYGVTPWALIELQSAERRSRSLAGTAATHIWPAEVYKHSHTRIRHTHTHTEAGYNPYREPEVIWKTCCVWAVCFLDGCLFHISATLKQSEVVKQELNKATLLE